MSDVAALDGGKPVFSDIKGTPQKALNLTSNCSTGSDQLHLSTLPVYDLGAYLQVSLIKSGPGIIMPYSADV